MIQQKNESVPAPEYLRRDTYPDVRSSMLYGGTTATDGTTGSESFPYYLQKFLDLQPDAMFFTANSALPIADSIRGAYAEIGQRTPELFAIRANSDLSLSFDEDASMFSASKRTVKNEIKEVKKVAAGMRAVVFDQYVETGGTLRLASYILKNAGVINIGDTPRARWYQETTMFDIDMKHVTSTHAEFMRGVGKEAINSIG